MRYVNVSAKLGLHQNRQQVKSGIQATLKTGTAALADMA
jgi:hypothetical protein